jgi:hypothetical protein
MEVVSAALQEAIWLLITADSFEVMLMSFGLAVVGAFSLLELWKWIREAKRIERI